MKIVEYRANFEAVFLGNRSGGAKMDFSDPFLLHAMMLQRS
jgi:hypothetical protein